MPALKGPAANVAVRESIWRECRRPRQNLCLNWSRLRWRRHRSKVRGMVLATLIRLGAADAGQPGAGREPVPARSSRSA